MTTYTKLDNPAYTNGTYATGINDAGKIVGHSNGASSGFVFASGIYTPIVPPGSLGNSNARGINDTGLIVGDYLFAQPNPFVTSAYIFNGTTFTTFDDPTNAGGGFGSGDTTIAYGVNDSGKVVGVSSWFKVTQGGGRSFLYDAGTFTTLHDPLAVNVGNNDSTMAQGINDSGQVVGYYRDASFKAHSFLYSGGTYTTLDDPYGANGTFAQGINNAGQIVGYFVDANGKNHGFLYSGGAWTTIDDPLHGPRPPNTNPEGTHAVGINNLGQIVGDYTGDSAGHVYGFLLNLSAAVSWKTGVSGNYSAGGNWNTNVAPGAADDVAITAGGIYTVTSIANQTVDSVSTAAGATLAILSGVFTDSGGLGSNNAGTMLVGAGATLVFNGFVANTGAINADGGSVVFADGSSLVGSGTVAVGHGGTIYASQYNAVFHGLGGSEAVFCTGNLNQAFADSGTALLYMAGNQNQLIGGVGSDWLGVTGNNNALSAGPGNDTWVGATGNTNTLSGGDGNDAIYANGSSNYLYGGNNNDWVGVSGNSNQLFGGAGNDWMGATGAGNVLAAGDDGSTVFAVGSNILFGGAGADWVGVSGGANWLFGAGGNDYVAATGNNNQLDGGTGNDMLVAGGSHSNDHFVFHPGYGADAISGFSAHVAGGSDVVDLKGFGLTFASLMNQYVTQAGADTVINLGGDVLTMLNVQKSGLVTSDFILV